MRLKLGFLINRLQHRQLFGRHPKSFFGKSQSRRSIGGNELFQQKFRTRAVCFMMNADGCFLWRHHPKQHQRIVQFIRIRRLGPRLSLHFVDRSRVQNAEAITAVAFGGTPGVNGLGAALL